MIKIIKGILYRMINNKSYLAMPLVIVPVIIAAAIYFSSSLVTRPNIGVVGIENIDLPRDEVNITKLQEEATLSDLVKNKYDAVVTLKDGVMKIDTVKGNDYKSKLEALVRGEEVDFKEGEKRGIGANIIGFLTMFLIMIGVMLYKFFFDEKKGMAKRIISTNVSYGQYIISHFSAVLLMIFVPTVVITLLSKAILKLDTSLTFIELSFLVFILSVLASSFGLLISSIVKNDESASMLGVMINVITTLIAGSFFTISNNDFISTVSKLMPQKHLLDFSIALENSNVINFVDISIVILFSVVMIILSLIVSKYKMRKYNCL